MTNENADEGMSRRQFLESAGAAGLAMGLGLTFDADSADAAGEASSEELRKAALAFLKYVYENDAQTRETVYKIGNGDDGAQKTRELAKEHIEIMLSRHPELKQLGVTSAKIVIAKQNGVPTLSLFIYGKNGESRVTVKGSPARR